MNDEKLKKCQKIMLKELIELDKICKKNNIRYWLDGGTLLGSVRHKGFIPWDDDIDVCMLKEDYKKFLRLSKVELPKNIFLQTKETDKYYTWFPYAKLRDRNSTFIEKYQDNNALYHQGIYIDIFEMDIYNDKIKKLYFLYKVLQKLSSIKISDNNRFLFLKKIYIKLKIKEIFLKILSLFKKNKEQSVYIGYMYLFSQGYKYEDIFPLSEIEFEGYKFPCPNNTDAYLKELYGDTYMKLPPKKNRGSHTKEIKLNEKCFFETELERTGRMLYEDE